jgi:SAM-dependent methyltransferase
MILEISEDIIRDISPNDEMNNALYWEVGRSAVETISQSLQAARKPATEVKAILDFPCGHGRVLRYLKAAFPSAAITACDLSRDGVDYCAWTFGATPVYSHEDATKISLERDAFDLIWVGSLFTHFDGRRWKSFLEMFASRLKHEGVLVFTTCGQHHYNRMRGFEPLFNYGISHWRVTLARYDYEHFGFGYGNYPGTTTYGISLSRPAWVCRQIAQVPELTLVHFVGTDWCGHDVYTCVRKRSAELEAERIPTFRYLRHRGRELAPDWLVSVAKRLLRYNRT